MVRYHNINGKSVQFTAEEETVRDAEEKAYADKSAERKLNTIKMIRLTKLQETEDIEVSDVTANSVTTVQEVLGDMMGDAPACNECGHITIRNGSCYKCLNCGNSLGCS